MVQLLCHSKVAFKLEGCLMFQTKIKMYSFLWRDFWQASNYFNRLYCEINDSCVKFVINYHEELDMTYTHTHTLNARSSTIVKLPLVKEICGRTANWLQENLSHPWPVRNILYKNMLKELIDPSIETPPKWTRKMSLFAIAWKRGCQPEVAV